MVSHGEPQADGPQRSGPREHAIMSEALVFKVHKPFSDSCRNPANNLPKALKIGLPRTVADYVFGFTLPSALSHLRAQL